MPNLRSTRSRKINQSENIKTKEVLAAESKSKSNKKANNTRAGRASCEKRILKEINCEKHLQKSNKGSKKIDIKMIEGENNNQTGKAGEEKLPEAMENNLNKSVDKVVFSAEKSTKLDGTEVENEEYPQKKKQKLDDTEALERDATRMHESSEDNKQLKKIQEVDAKGDEQTDRPTTSSNSLKHKSISLKSQNCVPKDTEEASSSGNNLPKQLLTVISNLYLNVGERLYLDFPPRCLDDLAFCHRHHYRSELPEAPITSQAHSLRSALQHYRYVLFINATTDMCHRGEFPGKGIFTKVIELVLSINYVTKQPNVNIATYQQSYHKSIALFSMIVRTFPPCWHKMRTYYVGFLEYGLDFNKLKNDKDEISSKSAKIFDILLDLLEEILKSSNPEDLITSKSEILQAPQNVSLDTTSPLPNSELSICSEYWNQNEYEQRERQKQTFAALPKDQKLERVFTALRLLLQILENDLSMWMLHHNKKTKEWIFCSENRPLIVVLCELTQYTRMTRVARRIFTIYSEAAAKGLCKKRLQVLERFISLLMVASNTADMENTAIGVKYPFLGEQTKTLIEEFFKIFKAHNREEIFKYLETIKLLRIPYVRYEFIDNVLMMFRFTNTEALTPQKIAIDIAKKRWFSHKPAAEMTNNDEDISREQYLHLLLDALRNYCEFHGSKTFLQVITNVKVIAPLTTTTDTVHRWPTHDSGVLVLKKMAKDIEVLEGKLKMTVRMSKPKVDLPLADICIDEEIILKYRTDLKFIVSLQNVLLKQKESYPDVDFTEWLQFLNDFSPKKKEEINNKEDMQT